MRRHRHDHAAGATGRVPTLVLGALVVLAGLAVLLLLATIFHGDARETGADPASAGEGAAHGAAAPATDGAAAHATHGDGTSQDAARATLASRAPGGGLDAAQAAAEAAHSRQVTLRVLDADEAPVPRARVTLWPPGAVSVGDDWPPNEPLRTAVTDARGTCVLDVDDPEQQLVAETDSLGSSGLWSVAEVSAAAGATTGATTDATAVARGTLTLRLQSWAVLRGSVRLPDGRPGPGVLVLFAPTGTPPGPGRARLPTPLRTDANGTFALQLDPGGLFEVVATAGGVTSPGQRVTARSGQVSVVELALPADYAITGTLLDPAGQPVPVGRVTWWADALLAHHEQGSAPEDAVSTRDRMMTVRDGTFRIPLGAPGRYTLVASGGDHAPCAPSHVELTEAQPVAGAVLVLEASETIAGHALDDRGKPLVDAVIMAVPAMWRTLPPEEGAPDATALYGETTTRTRALGEFQLRGLHPAASYRLNLEWRPPPSEGGSVVSPLELFAQLPDVPAGTHDVVLVAAHELATGFALRGLVLLGPGASAESAPDADPFAAAATPHGEAPIDDIRPAAGWSVEAFRTTRFGYYPAGPPVVTGVDGRFEIFGLGLGDRCALHVTRDDPKHATIYPEAETEWFLVTPDMGERIVQLESAATLGVSVHDDAGRPMPGAFVRLRRIGALTVEDRWAPIESDVEGRVAFRPVPAGRYDLRATRGAWFRAVTLDIADGEDVRVTLALQRED